MKVDFNKIAKLSVIISVLLGLGASMTSCQKNEENKNDTMLAATLAMMSMDEGTKTRDVTISFDAKDANGDSFDCARSIATGTESVTGQDLRFFISDIKLIKENGSEVEMTLNTDEDDVDAADRVYPYQYRNTVLLDFEDAADGCAMASKGGTASMNKVVTGKVAEGTYKGISFTVGLDNERNSLDNSTAASPMNVTSLYWSWTTGYKFMKFEFMKMISGNPYKTSFHLGALGCSGFDEENLTTSELTCTQPFLGKVELEGDSFDPDTNTVVLQLDKLMENLDTSASNYMYNDTMGVYFLSCMPNGQFLSDDSSSNQKSACEPLLSNMGIKFEDGNLEGTQQAFEIQ